MGLVEVEIYIMLELGQWGVFKESDGSELDFQLGFLVYCLVQNTQEWKIVESLLFGNVVN